MSSRRRRAVVGGGGPDAEKLASTGLELLSKDAFFPSVTVQAVSLVQQLAEEGRS